MLSFEPPNNDVQTVAADLEGQLDAESLSADCSLTLVVEDGPNGADEVALTGEIEASPD